MENIQNADQIEKPKASETVYPPSEKQLSLIEKLIGEGKPKPPNGFKTDARITNKYLDEVFSKREPSPPKPPTEKQSDLISKICDALDITADDVKTSKQAYDFIEKNMEAYKGKSKKKPKTQEEEAIEEDDFS